MIRKVIVVAALWFAACIVGAMFARHDSSLEAVKLSPGAREIQSLWDLFSAHQFDEVLEQCDSVENDPKCRDYIAQIWYVRWATYERLQKPQESIHIEEQFTDRFPDSVLLADMQFAHATKMLAKGDYEAADQELALIERRFPAAVTAQRATDIRRRLVSAVPLVPSRKPSANESGNRE